MINLSFDYLFIRFVPPRNVLGAPDDPDPERRNERNECYCLRDLNYRLVQLNLIFDL